MHSRLLSYVYYTQIMQAETLASAYRLWRRNWKGKGREYTAGALVWQVRPFMALFSYDTFHCHAPHLTPHIYGIYMSYFSVIHLSCSLIFTYTHMRI